MLDITIEKDLLLFQDYKKCLSYLNSIDDENLSYPSDPVNFHIYTEIKTVKELLCVESFLATQNLEKTRLILWSDYDISDNSLLEPYKELIDFRVYSPEEETKGTVLENCKEWVAVEDSKHYMKSGVLRFLVTHKYGGVWADMDMVFLRDLKPILDQEWAYMWGSELDFRGFGPCAAIMSIHKDSLHSNLCMQEIVNSKPVADSTVLDHVLLAKVYTKKRFTVFPSTFFNTEWQLNTTYVNDIKHYNSGGLGTQVESGWFEKNQFSSYLFEGAFAWHWHNSSYKNHRIEDGSKFDILMKLNKKALKQKGIL
jgi:hypothetical protein